MILNMRPIVLSISFLLLLIGLGNASKLDFSTCGIAFYYKKIPSKEMIKLYDYLVVDPDNIAVVDKKFIAYLSVGEIESYRKYYKFIKKDWIIGENKNWNTYIADTSNRGYLKFLESLVDSLYQKGFSGIFLDTLDSYQMVVKDKAEQKSFEDGLVSFITNIKKRYPDFFVITNRGFEIINNETKNYIDAVVAESLYTSYDFQSKRYINQTKDGKDWLLSQLNRVKSYGIDVIVIEYTNNKELNRRRELAKKILDLGFFPFISDIGLTNIGVGKCEYVPRKILIVYSKEASKDVYHSLPLRIYSTPLEYLGYFGEFIDPSEEELPEYTAGEYAGIIVSPEVDIFKNGDRFYDWVVKQIDEGMKVLFIDNFGFELTEDRQRYLGIKVSQNNNKNRFKLLSSKPYINFEVNINLNSSNDLFTLERGEPIILLENNNGSKHIPVAITEWGGYALYNSAYLSFVREMWAINPFEFFKDTLRLRKIPSPDVTTENGNRVFFSHLDGDGFIEVALFNKKKFASEIIRDEIFKKYNLPFTVSIIEGEVSPYGQMDQKTKRFEEIARSIFELENVEIASHSYSHPFKWQKMEKFENTQAYNLKIEGYQFDINREISGSSKYINEKLAPRGKKVQVFLWTGDCNPTMNAVKLTYENGLLNMNGGGSTMTPTNSYLTTNYPIGVKKGGYYQIFSPNQNENVYTDLWKSNFYGFRNVIQTFQLTDTPRRIKPINVYYHFYSGSKLSSLNAVKDVYNYAIKQKIVPMFASDYIKRSLDFYSTVIAIDLIDNSWLIRTDGNLRTVKIFDKISNPVLNSDILGFYDYNDVRYIHLNNKNDYKLILTDGNLNKPYLKSSNGIVKSFYRLDDGFKLHMYGYLPLEIGIANVSSCRIDSSKEFSRIDTKEGTILKFLDKEVNLEIKCTKS